MNPYEPLSDNPNDYLFIDTETRALPHLDMHQHGNITSTSVSRYARSSKVILVTYAIGVEDDVLAWPLTDFDSTLNWRDAPPELADMLNRIHAGEAWAVAFNSAFDRHVCNHGMIRASKRMTFEIDNMIDLMAQCAASSLPQSLDGALRSLGLAPKKKEGKNLIKLFCRAEGSTPQEHPEEWGQFIDYGVRDVAGLQDLFEIVRPLPRREWEEFWASEEINDRGLPIDRKLAQRAALMADVYLDRVNARVSELSQGDLWSVNQHKAMAEYVYDQLVHLSEAAEVLVKKYDEEEEGGELVPAKLGLDRNRVERLIPMLERLDREQGLTDEEFDILQLLEERQYGASAAPKKFGKMAPMLTPDDRLPGQYVFNGAARTGRFSSRGVQMHNLTRRHIGYEPEADAIDYLLEMEKL